MALIAAAVFCSSKFLPSTNHQTACTSHNIRGREMTGRFLQWLCVWLAVVAVVCDGWSTPRLVRHYSSSVARAAHDRNGGDEGGTVSIPVDTFGDFNEAAEEEGELEEEEVWSEYSDQDLDSAQTIFPFLEDWRFDQEDNSLRGVVFNHPTFTDGSVIATSQLSSEDVTTSTEGDDDDEDTCSGLMRPEDIVTTVTGSQYLLGKQLVVGLKEWTFSSEGELVGVVTSSDPHGLFQEGECVSIFPIIVDNNSPLQEGQTIATTDCGHLYHLHTPFVTMEQAAVPEEVVEEVEEEPIPILEQWKRLEGGSLAGIVFHHKEYPDDELITTSPLVELDESKDGIVLVTTATGSQYLLGEPEPPKVFAMEQEEVQVEEEPYEVEYDPSIYYGEDDEDQDEELQRQEIPSYHIPKNPKQQQQQNPLQHIFAAAADLHDQQVKNLHEFLKLEKQQPQRRVFASTRNIHRNHALLLDTTGIDDENNQNNNNNNNNMVGNHTAAALEHS
ncbi:expressed unknown protein [Seminavis robusta]|uniref:Uncharacterized protein n=1 Tax=Seminavis robusta TaxID=568900 RepID=A0A9N8EDY8_9STRA|nr:expressed unknown protein [Seminavis robusta]|eukprot:Sro937_g222210.1 n/a (500) ;mRNA; f:26114-27613